ncbi:ABC transporter ATP-binding protein/permease [Synechococcus sp. CB0101]|uniref:ABC transporter ATP-binding protein/permease n=1 Tax=Synechococcus sp. CB0101 TaxID=232348 RepID=UPI0002001507|nr:ATP-binding cassette domain-containing protein [Synechococcus sp. CB0101]QCH15625.1 ABC transporter ATP-binding protein/permease [Synechococcus sp. CB0101]
MLRSIQNLGRLIAPFFTGSANKRSIAIIAIYLILAFLIALGLAMAGILAVQALISWLVPQSIATSAFAEISSFTQWLRQSHMDALTASLAGAAAVALAAASRSLQRPQKTAWLYVIGSFTLLLLLNAMLVDFSYLANHLTNAFTSRNESQAKNILIGLALILGGLVPVFYSSTLVSRNLANFWRSVSSQQYINNYLRNNSFFRISSASNTADRQIDNPDQRITQDTDEFTQEATYLFFELVRSFISTASFSLVLWSINPVAFGIVIVYALTGTAIGAGIGRKLFKLNYKQLELNADFRYAVIQVRDNAESIAFYRGESAERTRMTAALDSAINNKYKLIKNVSAFGAYQATYANLQIFVPYILLWTTYFNGDVEFGAISQTAIAFSSVMGTFSFLVDNFTSLATLSSNAVRLEELSEALIPTAQIQGPGSQSSDAVIDVKKACLHVPHTDRLLIKDLTLNVSPHDRILLVGSSGTGKTSLLRMLSGLWHPSAGSSHSKGLDDGVIFVPQKPYLFRCSLKELLFYPHTPRAISTEQIAATLKAANLPNLLQQHPDPDEVVEWQKVLSVGEQQRIAFARVMLSQASFALLDEATSALDTANERAAYQQLQQSGMGYISVGHRPSLLEHHSKVLELQAGGHWRLIEADQYAFAS